MFVGAVSDNFDERIEQKIFHQIKADVKQIVADELKRIANDPALQHLIKKEG
jgi:hypothetical protein